MTDVGPAALAAMWHSAWVQGALAFILWVGAGLLLRRYLIRLMQRVALRTAWTWDNILVRALSKPSLIAILASGLLIVGRILPLGTQGDRAFDVMLAAALSLAIVLFVDRATSGLLEVMEHRQPALRGARGLLQGVVRGVVVGIGVLIFLDSIGISIKPILASLGVGSLAVALGLQSTVANLFAGLYLLADKPIEPGHFVRLQGGEEGTVLRVGWRSTWIQTPENSIVVVPNTQLAGSVLTNFDLPDSRLNVTLEVIVPLQGDLEKIESVTAEVARDTQMSVEGAARDLEPKVRFVGFAESGLRLQVVLGAQDRAGSFVIKHQFMKRLMARYRREGIAVPFPTRTIDLPPETPAQGPSSSADRPPSLPAGEHRA